MGQYFCSEWFQNKLSDEEPVVWQTVFTSFDVDEEGAVGAGLKVGIDLESNIWVLDYIEEDENGHN